MRQVEQLLKTGDASDKEVQRLIADIQAEAAEAFCKAERMIKLLEQLSDKSMSLRPNTCFYIHPVGSDGQMDTTRALQVTSKDLYFPKSTGVFNVELASFEVAKRQ